jgi:undecaprenyl pyrophosphate phosphatase UppP
MSVGSVIKYLTILIADPNSELLSINWQLPTQIIYYGAAMIASILATIFALKFMYRLFREGRLMGFSAYTFILGTIALLTGIIIA